MVTCFVTMPYCGCFVSIMLRAHTHNRENELVSLGSGRVKNYVLLAFHCITTSQLTDTKHDCENEALNSLSHKHAHL